MRFVRRQGLIDETCDTALRPEGRTAMLCKPQPAIRELDHRCNDGIDVSLLWDPETDRVFLTVDDRRRGESRAVEVRPADALDAFHHPYAYVGSAPTDHALAA
jgi:hypothetical protein